MMLTMIMANIVKLSMDSSTSLPLPPNARSVFWALFLGRVCTRGTKQYVYDVEHEQIEVERQIVQFVHGGAQNMELK